MAYFQVFYIIPLIPSPISSSLFVSDIPTVLHVPSLVIWPFLAKLYNYINYIHWGLIGWLPCHWLIRRNSKLSIRFGILNILPWSAGFFPLGGFHSIGPRIYTFLWFLLFQLMWLLLLLLLIVSVVPLFIWNVFGTLRRRWFQSSSCLWNW